MTYSSVLAIGRLIVAIALLVVMTAVKVFAADEGAAATPGASPHQASPEPPATSSNGSLSYSVDINVPAFRGFEPDLTLSYNSSAQARGIATPNGNMGIGWSMPGLSYIERVSGSPTPLAPAGRGAPVYDSGLDSFTLDGQEMVQCNQMPDDVAARVVSCTNRTGFSYATRVDNFKRIRRFDGTTNEWQVTDQDGTKTTYKDPLPGAVNANSYRWLINSVTDRYSNNVKYTWNCSSYACLISKIEYFNRDGSTPANIVFSHENRFDKISFGTGNAIGRADWRISAITVNSAAASLRKYTFGYEFSASTKLSRLKTVTEAGKDGLPLPPYQFSYSDLNGSGSGQLTFDLQNWKNIPIDAGRFPRVAGDFNGDGNIPDYFIPLHQVSQTTTGGGNTVYTCSSEVYFASGTSAAATRKTLSTVNSGTACADFGNDSITEYHMTGDFDADGADDIVRINQAPTCPKGDLACTTPPKITIFKWSGNFSTGSFVSVASVNGPPGYGAFDGGIHTIADFTGDGVAEILTHRGNVWSRSGATFESKNWAATSAFQSSRTSNLGDFNGDGKSDVLLHDISGGNWNATLYISTGSTFKVYTQTIPTSLSFSNSSWLFADANADGLTDVIVSNRFNASTYEIRRFISRGNHFNTSSDLAQPVKIDGFSAIPTNVFSGGYIQNSYRPPAVLAANFDGDGFADLLMMGDTMPSTDALYAGRPAYAVVRGVAYTAYDNLPINGGNPGSGGFVKSNIRRPRADNNYFDPSMIADFNGDGFADLYDGSDGSDDHNMQINLAKQPDLLVKVTTPMGGKTDIAYSNPSNTAVVARTRLPFTPRVVASITTSDGVRPAAVTAFKYEGGAWDPIERQFKGFSKVTTTHPLNAGELESVRPVTVVNYKQDTPCRGRVDKVVNMSGASTLQTTENFYTTIDARVPYRCDAWEVDTTLAGSPAKKTVKRYSYDNYGNVLVEDDLGVDGYSDDNVTTWFGYVKNDTDFLSCRNSAVTVKTGDTVYTSINKILLFDAAGNRFRDVGDPNNPSIPKYCDSAGEEQNFSVSPWSVATTLRTYDSFGNLETVTDPVSNVTRYVYDTAYKLYVEQVQLPKFAADARFKTSTSWDKVCQLPKTQTDMNGQVTSHEYDGFCREIRVNRPGGDFTMNDYKFPLGNASQYIQTRKRLPQGDGSTNDVPANTAWSTSYIDGFGRTYWQDEKSADASNWHITETVYNARGKVSWVTGPYLVNDAVSVRPYQNFTYDALDRLIWIGNSDGTPAGTSVEYRYTTSPLVSGMLDVKTIDQIKHEKILTYDARGALIQRTKMDGATPAPRNTPAISWAACKPLSIPPATNGPTPTTWLAAARR